MPLPLFLLNCSLLQTQQKCSVRFSRGNPWHWSFKILLFSSSVMSDSLRPHESQHARLPCPSPSPGVCSNSCPLSQWFHPTSSSSVSPFSSYTQSFPESVFSSESALHIRWPEYWSFSFSTSLSSEYSWYWNSQIHRDRKWTGGQRNLRGKGHEELGFHGSRVSAWEDKNVLEMDGGDGSTRVRMYLVPLNYTLKMVKIVNFMLFSSSGPQWDQQDNKCIRTDGLPAYVQVCKSETLPPSSWGTAPTLGDEMLE